MPPQTGSTPHVLFLRPPKLAATCPLSPPTSPPLFSPPIFCTECTSCASLVPVIQPPIPFLICAAKPGSQLSWRGPTLLGGQRGWVGGWVWRVRSSSRVFCCVWVQVSLTYSANETQPGEVIDLRVRAARGSCVCVAAVDKSIYLLRSGFRLTPTQVSGGPWALGSSILTDVSSFPITEKPRINPDCLSSLGSFLANPILVAVWVQLKDLGVKSNVTLSGSHLFSPMLPILKMG